MSNTNKKSIYADRLANIRERIRAGKFNLHIEKEMTRITKKVSNVIRAQDVDFTNCKAYMVETLKLYANADEKSHPYDQAMKIVFTNMAQG